MELTHLDDEGRARMVDVGGKAATRRRAVAEGRITMSGEALAALRGASGPKGDALQVARIAGIMAAKRTSDLIPLCHPLALTHAAVDFEVADGGVTARATTETTGQTGVEMEALTAVTVALLTVYDMLKAVDRGMVIGPVRLLEKHGGKSGS